MKLRVGELYSKGELYLDEEIDFTNEQFNDYSLKSINSCKVKAHAYDTGELIHIDFKIEAIVTLICSISLDEFEKVIKFNDFIEITDNPELENGDIFLDKKPVIDLNQYILPMIKCYIPIKPVKPKK